MSASAVSGCIALPCESAVAADAQFEDLIKLVNPENKFCMAV